MPNRQIVLTDLTKQPDLQRLKTYLTQLFTIADPRYQTVPYAASVSADVNISETFLIILTGNITTVSVLNAAIGRRLRFIFLQDATGNRTVGGWPAAMAFSGGSFTPTATANKYSVIDFEYQNAKWVETSRSLNVS